MSPREPVPCNCSWEAHNYSVMFSLSDYLRSFYVRNNSIEFFLFQLTKFYPIPTSAELMTEPEVPVTTPELDPETSTSTSTTCSSSSRMTSSAT